MATEYDDTLLRLDFFPFSSSPHRLYDASHQLTGSFQSTRTPKVYLFQAQLFLDLERLGGDARELEGEARLVRQVADVVQGLRDGLDLTRHFVLIVQGIFFLQENRELAWKHVTILKIQFLEMFPFLQLTDMHTGLTVASRTYHAHTVDQSVNPITSQSAPSNGCLHSSSHTFQAATTGTLAPASCRTKRAMRQNFACVNQCTRKRTPTVCKQLILVRAQFEPEPNCTTVSFVRKQFSPW